MKALNEFLRPEFINRVDEVICFNQLTETNFRAIAELMLGELRENMERKNITLTWDDSLVDHIVREGYSVTYGARNLRRVLDSRVAHLKNSAMGSSVGGYATVGAMFVKEFVEETPWIHLDIGGTAWTTECEGIYTKGGIGFGTRMLYETFKVMEKEGTQV